MLLFSWRAASLLLAFAMSACTMVPVKLQLDATHPAQPSAAAQRWADLPQQLSADDAVRVALAHSPALKADYARLGIARADVIAASTLANPVLSIERRSSGIGVERSVGIMQDLLGALLLPARKQFAQTDLARAEVESAQRVLTHGYAVRAAYIALQGDAQTLDLLTQATTATAAAAELAQRQFAAGNISRLQLAQHQAFDSETQLELSRAKAAFSVQREALNAMLGAWGTNTDWTLPERLPTLPAMPPNAPEAEAVALTQRLDLTAMKQALAATQSALAFTRDHRLLSSLGIGFSRTRDSSGEKLKGPSVELGLPLFDRSQAALARLSANGAAQAQELEQLAIDIRAQVRSASARLLTAHANVQQHERALLPQHEAIVAETQLRYNGMLSDVYELLAVKRAQLTAARSYVDSLRDYWLAQTELEKAIGARLQQTPATPPTPAAADTSTNAPTVSDESTSKRGGETSPAPSGAHQHHQHHQHQ